MSRNSRLNERVRHPHSISHNGISVHFRDIEDEIVRAISQCTGVVGCVAWLRSPRILRALSNVPCNIAITNDVNLPRRQYKTLTARDTKYAAVGKVGLARGKMRHLMHHKFIVGFLDNSSKPSFVITGSFNFTVNSAANNLENVVRIDNAVVAAAYYEEALEVLKLSRSAC